MENPIAKAKIEAGVDPVTAGREAVAETEAATTAKVMGKLVVCVAAILIGILGIIASIMGAGAAKMPSIGKIKGGIILGIIALVLAVAANIYGFTAGYTAYTLQFVGLIAELVFGLLFVVAIMKYKNALVALLSGE